MAISKGGKIVVGILAGVCTLGAGFVIAYNVSDDFKATVDDLVNKIANKFKSDEKKDEERKENIQEDDRYKQLEDDNKKEFDEKFDKITKSDEYKDMTDDEKNDLVDKLIDSEKLQQDIVQEQEQQETRNEEIKQELGGMSEELNNILTSEEELSQSEQVAQVAEAIANTKNELEEIINSDTATAEEIAEAQEKLEKVESLEQEYVANQTTSSITETASNDYKFQYNIGNLTLNKINGLYACPSGLMIDAEFIQKEIIADVEIFSKINGFAELYNQSNVEDLTYAQLINAINSESESGRLLFTYTNVNEEWHKNYFDENTTYINKWGGLGYDVIIVQSFIGNGDVEHPMYIIQIQDKISGSVLGGMNFIKYNKETQTYESLPQEMQKICPEFWAQVEAEQAQQKQQEQTSKAKAEAAVENYTTTDANGNVTGFNYPKLQQDRQAKAENTKTTKETTSNVIYPDLDLSH